MRKHNRSSHALAAKHKGNFGANLHQNSATKDNNNKRGYSAEGYSLLTSALRPRLFGIGIAVSLATVIGITLNASDNQASAVSATLSVPEGISVNANPSANNGFAESSNGAVSVSTGNQMGYTLTIKAKDNNQLKNGSSVLNSISTNLTADQYKNGDYINTWGFKPSSINSSTNTSYIPGPTTSGITLAQTNANSTSAESYSLGIAAKVDSNAVAGNYQNTFILTATANDAHYNITFNKNGGSGGPSSTQYGSIGSSTYVNIASGTPSYSGKDFLGWCSVNPGTGDTCNGVLVQPGGQFPLCKCDLNITLYAMYGKKPAEGAVGAFAGQSNGTSCRYNNREGIVYGGLCWMWSDLKNDANNYTWENAKTACTNAGWRLPSKTEFEVLLQGIGSGSQLYSAGWTSYFSYWSSTEYNSSDAYVLEVDNSFARITNDFKTNYALNARCVVG